VLIQKYINQSYKTAKDKGFYPDDSTIDKHLTGIVSELYEVYEAHRSGNFTNKKIYTTHWFNNPNHLSKTWCDSYIKNVKDSLEDEVTDLFIRIFNLAAHLNIKLNDIYPDTDKLENYTIDNQIIFINKSILYFPNAKFKKWFDQVLNTLYGFCSIYGINIKIHIEAKIEFNKSREYLHGKKY
jgi:NTP pyrophosphatase (non-canonical NTP hydrolase)